MRPVYLLHETISMESVAKSFFAAQSAARRSLNIYILINTLQLDDMRADKPIIFISRP